MTAVSAIAYAPSRASGVNTPPVLVGYPQPGSDIPDVHAAGSGGSLLDIRDLLDSTGSYFVRSWLQAAAIDHLGTMGDERAGALVASGQVAKIRAAFGLTIRDLAEVLGVERQTVYGWLRAQRAPQERNIARLTRLCLLASEIPADLMRIMPSDMAQHRIDELSLIQLLALDEPSVDMVVGHMSSLITTAEGARDGVSIREVVARRGMQSHEEDGNQRIDLETGKVGR